MHMLRKISACYYQSVHVVIKELPAGRKKIHHWNGLPKLQESWRAPACHNTLSHQNVLISGEEGQFRFGTYSSTLKARPFHPFFVYEYKTGQICCLGVDTNLKSFLIRNLDFKYYQNIYIIVLRINRKCKGSIRIG